MSYNFIFAVLNVTLFILSLGGILLSIWQRDRLSSEAAWDKLAERSSILKWGFLLTFFSLLIYLVSESASLINKEAPSTVLLEIHELGEIIHMTIALLIVFIFIPLFIAMWEVEDDS